MSEYAVVIIIACLLCILMLFACTWYVMRLKSIVRVKYNELMLERAKISERANSLSSLENKYNKLLADYNQMCIKASELETALKIEKENTSDKVDLIKYAGNVLSDKFSALSAEALAQNNQSFLNLAKASFENLQLSASNKLDNSTKEMQEITQPIKKALSEVDEKLQSLENNRIAMCQAITEQINSLISSQDKLKLETYKLSSALKIPNIRGRWGEMQLRRVVEIAGMMKHCDFEEQVISEKDDNIIRPDMIVHLPENRTIIVDAKAPLSAYMNAVESSDDSEKNKLFKIHAKQVRNHCIALGNKNYTDQFVNSPDFVVMFLPGEVFFSSALEQDPSLIEFAIEHHVIIATPTTLLALLHAIAAGWRNEMLSENARHIVQMGKDLHKTLKTLNEYMIKLGKNVASTSESYNLFNSYMNKEVLTVAHEFNKLEIAKISHTELE